MKHTMNVQKKFQGNHPSPTTATAFCNRCADMVVARFLVATISPVGGKGLLMNDMVGLPDHT